jgi:hypothetical protein
MIADFHLQNNFRTKNLERMIKEPSKTINQTHNKNLTFV